MAIVNFDVFFVIVFCTLIFGIKRMSLSFQDANGYSAESLISFHDFVCSLLLPILILTLIIMVSYFLKFPLFRSFLDSQCLEFVWSLLPVVILLRLVLPSLSLLYLLDEVGSPSLTRHVTGNQWYWSYSIDEAGSVPVSSYPCSSALRNLGADSSLILPSGLVFRILVSSSDVLHCWALPSFGLKADCVPGRLNSLTSILDRTGVFYGQCSEICGSNHSFMPISCEVPLFLEG